MSKHTYAIIDRLVDDNNVLSFALSSHAELRRDKRTSVLVLTGQEQAVYCKDGTNNETVGIVVFYQYEDEPYFQVDLAYVNKFDRKSGVFRDMMDKLSAHAAAYNLKISIGTHVLNTRMQAVLVKLGAKPQYITYDYPVPGNETK